MGHRGGCTETCTGRAQLRESHTSGGPVTGPETSIHVHTSSCKDESCRRSERTLELVYSSRVAVDRSTCGVAEDRRVCIQVRNSLSAVPVRLWNTNLFASDSSCLYRNHLKVCFNTLLNIYIDVKNVSLRQMCNSSDFWWSAQPRRVCVHTTT